MVTVTDSHAWGIWRFDRTRSLYVRRCTTGHGMCTAEQTRKTKPS